MYDQVHSALNSLLIHGVNEDPYLRENVGNWELVNNKDDRSYTLKFTSYPYCFGNQDSYLSYREKRIDLDIDYINSMGIFSLVQDIFDKVYDILLKELMYQKENYRTEEEKNLVTEKLFGMSEKLNVKVKG